MDHDVDHAIFFNKVKKARDSLNGLTKEERKLAISFLQQTLELEEDAKAQSSSSNSKEAGEIFKGLTFKYPPASKEDYINAYDEYVRRCSN